MKEVFETPPTRHTVLEADSYSATMSSSSRIRHLDCAGIQMVDTIPTTPRNVPDVEAKEELPHSGRLATRDTENTLNQLICSGSTDLRRSVFNPTPGTAQTSAECFPHQQPALRQIYTQEKEDLNELEELMIPAAVRQGYRDGGALPIDPRPPLLGYKVSKFTTGLISTSGWIPIENEAWETLSKEYHASRNIKVPSTGGDQEFTVYADLPEKLAKTKAVKHQNMTKGELDIVLNDLSQINEKPLIDPKYFDLGSYIDHVQTAEERQAQRNASMFFAHSEAIDNLVTDSESESGPTIDSTAAKYTDDQLESTTGGPEAAANDGVARGDKYSTNTSDAAGGDNPGTTSLKAQGFPAFTPHSLRRRSMSPSNLKRQSVDSHVEIGTQTLGTGLSRDQKGNWELMDDSIDMPRVGQSAPEKLIIRLQRKDTSEIETHTFQKISSQFVDWNDKKHVEEISHWRSQVFQSRGFVAVKSSNVWLPTETSWLMLFHKKLKVFIEAGHIIRLPGPAFVAGAFNNFFEGKILQNSDGTNLPAREARDESSIKAKLAQHSSGIKLMRDTMRKLLEGRPRGMIYVPDITEAEFDQYIQHGTVSTVDADKVDGGSAQPRLCVSPTRKRDIQDVSGISEKRVKQ